MKAHKLILALGTALVLSVPAFADEPSSRRPASPMPSARPGGTGATGGAGGAGGATKPQSGSKPAAAGGGGASGAPAAGPAAGESPPGADAAAGGEQASDESGKEGQGARSAAATSSTAHNDVPEGEPGWKLPPEEYEPPKPLSAQEVDAATTRDQQLTQMELEGLYYEQGQKSYHQDVKDLIRLQYAAQKEMLASQYDRAVDDLEQEERNRRLEAIARFEEFLRKYPNDPTYSPDAMFRLAELYFERSSDEYLASSKAYEKQLAAFERGERPDEPPAPEPHFEKVIGLHQDLLDRFPNYRLADAAEYLVGYCYGEQGQSEEALHAFLDLTEKHPQSKFLAEVWTRIGEIYFDKNDSGSLNKAIDAYAKVLKYKDSPYYDKALYKIAWTYYRLDKYSEAVSNFISLIQYSDEQKQRTGKTGSDLRTEAIQYVAVSLAEEEWGGLSRAKEVLGPYGERTFVGEIWKRYGEILFDQTKYPMAIQVLEYTLSKHPNAPANPEIQAKIVSAYEQQRDFDGATNEREKLVQNYSEGSAWFEANRNDKEAISRARDLTEKSLFTAAIFRHQQAQQYKKDNRLEDAKRSYQAAATAYKLYLSRFPNAKNAYDFEFFLAECLYYSDEYMAAASQYDKVRDSTVDNKHLEAAALSSVITYRKEIEHQEAQGKLSAYKVITATERKGKKPEPKAIEPIYQKMIDSADRYVRLIPKGERTPAIAYYAAEAYYTHDQLDEARKRFQDIIAAAPTSQAALFAGNLITESYLAVEDWAHVRSWSDQLADLRSKALAAAKTPEEKKQLESGIVDAMKTSYAAQFKQAQQYEAAGQFEEAANTYVNLVDRDPKNDIADKSLFNAAVNYEKVKRFETASNVYQRIVDQYPSSDLAPRALFRVGVNYEKGYDFPSAIAAYNRLVDKYPNSENRADALYNEAVTLENMQQYAQAAQAFKKYATTFEAKPDAGENFFRSALVYEKMKAWPEMIDTLKTFISKYKNAPAQKERVVEAYLKMGTAYQEQRDEKDALAAYNNCVKEYTSRHFAVEAQASAHAAKCTFEIAEAQFKKYDALKLSGRGQEQARALANKAKMQREVEKAFTDVFKYKRAETTLAASYRIGYSYERFAQAMRDAEIPPEFKNNQELIDEYRAQLDQKAEVLDHKAEQAYRKALDEAKKTHVTNEWTELCLESLNRYKPEEFPVQRNGKALMQTFTISGNGLDNLAPGAQPSKVPESGADVKRPAGTRTAEAEGGE